MIALQLRRANQQLKKYEQRLLKGMKSGQFKYHSANKKHVLIERINKLRLKVLELSGLLKKVGAGAALTLGLGFATESQGQIDWQQVPDSLNPVLGIDVGNNSSPTLVDIDADGDLDLFIANAGGEYHYYKNEGDSSSPVFTEQTGTDNPLTDAYESHGYYAHIVFADMDNDGDFDAIISGSIYDSDYGGPLTKFNYYKNNGDSANVSFEYDGEWLDSEEIYGYSKLSLCDVDVDGDYDIVIGHYNEGLIYYENTGTPAQATFSLVDYNDGPFANIDYSDEMRVTFMDIDNDNDPDMVVGDLAGNIYLYENTGDTPQEPYFELNETLNNLHGTAVADVASPELGDLNGDSFTELIVGSNDGTLLYYCNKTVPVAVGEVSSNDLRAYPNPVSNKLTISTDNIEINKVEIFDNMGTKVSSQIIDGMQSSIDFSDLNKGVYHLNMHSKKGILLVHKITKL